MNWIFIALSGYLLLAFTGVADKFLVSKIVRAPVAYAFYTAMTGPFSLILILFGNKYWGKFQFMNLTDTLVALLAGSCFIIAIYFSYSAIGEMSVSRVV